MEIYTREDKYFAICSNDKELALLATGDYTTGKLDPFYPKGTGKLLKGLLDNVGMTKCTDEVLSAKILLIS